MNRKNSLIIILWVSIFFCSLAVKSQSKINIQTTKDWISEKLEMYAPLAPKFPLNSGYEQHKYIVKFEGCNLIIEERWENVEENGMYMIYTIPINEMNIPTFGYTSTELVKHLMNIYFTTKGSKGLIKIESVNAEYGNTIKYENKLALFIEKNCELDNIPERLKKAFKDLISSCGGKIIDNAY